MTGRLLVTTLVILWPLLSGCTTVGHWVSSHFDGGAWGRAASPYNPNHALSLILLASAGPIAHNDDRWSRSAAENQSIGGSNGEYIGDALQVLLAASPVVAITTAAVVPDHKGEALEVLEISVESAIVTIGLTQALKNIFRRERPTRSLQPVGRKKSFPSGHVASAMAGAAVTGRWLRTRNKHLWPVEVLLYTGVAYVAMTRIENEKHWPSDTVAGAILGGYVANTLWDAHYGRDSSPGFFHRLREHVVVAPIEDGFGVMFYFAF